MSMRDAIKNAQLTMTRAVPVQTDAPYDSGPITSRFSVETALMYEKIAPYAGNVFQALKRNFYDKHTVEICISELFII